jgi:hypothetical protein
VQQQSPDRRGRRTAVFGNRPQIHGALPTRWPATPPAGCPVALRHSFASLLVAEGKQPIWCAKQLGHSLAALVATYAHLIDELDDRERIDADAEIANARAPGLPQLRDWFEPRPGCAPRSAPGTRGIIAIARSAPRRVAPAKWRAGRCSMLRRSRNSRSWPAPDHGHGSRPRPPSGPVSSNRVRLRSQPAANNEE